MRNRLNIVLAGLASLALASCVKEQLPQPRAVDGIPLRIVPTIADVAQTRAKIEGTTFPDGYEIGLNFHSDNERSNLPAHYYNFKAKYDKHGGASQSSWHYYLQNNDVGDVLRGYSTWFGVHASGYYPYDPSMTNHEAIPFRIASLVSPGVAEGTAATASTDYMRDFAVFNLSDGYQYVTPNLQQEISLTLEHIMTAIELVIDREPQVNSGSDYPEIWLGSATFEVDNGREFIIAGTYTSIGNSDNTCSPFGRCFNAAGTETASKLTITYPRTTDYAIVPTPSGQTPSRKLLVIMPELIRYSNPGSLTTPKTDDATVTITFGFVDAQGNPFSLNVVGGKPQVSFKLSDISGFSGSLYQYRGLYAGYSYAVTATLGSYETRSAGAGAAPASVSPHRPPARPCRRA